MSKEDQITVSVGALLSLTTGRLLCDFNELHRAADVVTGQPLMTHNFASQRLSDQMAAECNRQHPWTADPLLLDDFPDLDNVPRESCQAVIESWLERSIYPQHGRTCVLMSPPERRRVPLTEGLPAKFDGDPAAKR